MNTIGELISPHYQAFNIGSQRQLRAFTAQLKRYFQEQSRVVQEWVKNASPADLGVLEEEFYLRYGISSQALRAFHEHARLGQWERSQIVSVANALVLLQTEAITGRLQANNAIKLLFRVDDSFGQFLNVSMDPEARKLRPFDVVGWERILAGECEGGRVTNKCTDRRQVAPTSEITLTESQKRLLESLCAHWQVKQNGECVAGYDPRPLPLIVGPSGSGKSALVRHFAATQHLPMKDFNVGTWLISGAKVEPQTLCEIGEFIRNHDSGVLFIDEVDKLIATTDWSRGVQQEVYALLDGRTDSFTGWDSAMAKRLKESFFIIGAGTWQSRYLGRQRTLGFAAQKGEDAWSIELEGQDEIPEELLMRFNADVLYLQPLTEAEFGTRILAIHDALALAQPTEERLKHLSEKAVASRRHNRWLEAYASHLLRNEVW